MDDLHQALALIGEVNSLKNEIARLEKAISSETPIEEAEEVEEVETSYKEEEEIPIDTLQEEASFYYEDIKNYLLSNMGNINIAELKELLPSRDNRNYDLLIRRILLELKKDSNEISSFLTEEEVSEEFYQEFVSEREALLVGFRMIKEIDLNKERIEEVPIKNRIVFLEREKGSTTIDDDLKSIPRDFYDSFLELLESIENGTFKGVKRFTNNNNKIMGICEVKGSQVRVIFDRLDSHTYVVIAAFIKKVNKDNHYHTFLKKRVQIYSLAKDSIMSSLNDLEYMERHAEYLAEVYRTLGATPEGERVLRYV